MTADVPAYITAPAFVQNGVKVISGTNWDYSRGAVPTPIVEMPDPQPLYVAMEAPATGRYEAQDNVPATPPQAIALFSANHAELAAVVRADLRALDKHGKYLVIGHADKSEKHAELLSRKRANAVLAQLKRQGFKSVTVKSFGDRRASPDTSPGSNQIVEIIAVD